MNTQTGSNRINLVPVVLHVSTPRTSECSLKDLSNLEYSRERESRCLFGQEWRAQKKVNIDGEF